MFNDFNSSKKFDNHDILQALTVNMSTVTQNGSLTNTSNCKMMLLIVCLFMLYIINSSNWSLVEFIFYLHSFCMK